MQTVMLFACVGDQKFGKSVLIDTHRCSIRDAASCIGNSVEELMEHLPGKPERFYAIVDGKQANSPDDVMARLFPHNPVIGTWRNQMFMEEEWGTRH